MRQLQYTWLLCLFFLITSVQGLSSQCSSGSYACPVCDGTTTIQVKDCLKCDGFLQMDMKHHTCFDRRLFNLGDDDEHSHYHFWWNDIVGAIIWFITAGIAVSCGVGGGGVYVPLGIIILQFAPKPAAGLLQASIFGACIGGFILNTRSRHPREKIRHDPGVGEARPMQLELKSEREEKEYLDRGGVLYTRPVIDYDMFLFTSPLQVAGAVLGVLIQKLLPNWLYLMTAGVLLAMSAAKEAKAREHQQATENEQKQVKSDDDTPQTDNVECEGKNGAHRCLLTLHNDETESAETNGKLQKDPNLEARIAFLEHDKRQYPLEQIAAVCIFWCGLFVLNLMIGGKEFQSVIGIDCQSTWYSVLITTQFLWLFSFAAYYGSKLIPNQVARRSVQYPFLNGDTAWDPSLLRFYFFSSFMSGAVGGLIGIGGASILGPLMLVKGVHPSVSTATNATMVMMTSSSVAVMYVISGIVPTSYAVFYFFVCLAGALFGKSKIDAYVKRTGRTSLLILILVAIIAFATIGCFVILLIRLADQDWCFDGFNEFCDVSSTEDNEDICVGFRDQILDNSSSRLLVR
ncbi:hypothetical protein FisN_33Lh054 [Fistulifera solaris]|uniref:Sulfite exporter TauE/SafE n=1 Tax=Fistulifera solaris TaxID=1519565 RepID=A0A1Z5KAN2_FISSO|nr:hypothetical protein FisN_33Lh054 [Fistulifera solaris]|eukprot:GAX23161.1 hypothetical protein FisN_33Lh054 [Fistulifera solaris]